MKKIINKIRNAYIEGSLTLEAAVVLPFFIFCVLAIISYSEFIRANADIETNLHRIGKEIALYSYAEKKLSDYSGINGVGANLIASAVSDEYAMSKMDELFTEENGQSVFVTGGGLEFINFVTSFTSLSDDYVNLSLMYKVWPFCSIWGYKPYFIPNRCYLHIWSGYGGSLGLFAEEAGDSEEVMVYIAENGTVYHRSSSCSYLDLSITPIDSSQINNSTNSNGSHYRSCEICGGSIYGVAYVTDYGDCYHSTLSCSGLKRTIRAVPLSEAVGYPACSRCGGAH